MFKLDGKIAIVTGGASGIGEAVARRFLAAGASVTIADVSDAGWIAVEKACSYRRTDVGDQRDVEALVEDVVRREGRLDIMVNNAGVAMNRELTAIDTARLEWIFRINAFGVLYGMSAAARHMGSGGSIINTASEAGIRGMPGLVEYGATKGAVVAATYSAAMELGPRNIRVNAVCPGIVKTPMNARQASRIGRSAPLVTALERPASPDEVAALVHFLASDDAIYVTGQAMAVDGGWNAGTSIRSLAPAI